MPISFYNKTISPDRIWCHGITNLNITMTGKPNITESPTDIILALDSSGSMSGQPLIDEKAAAVEFVNLLAEVTSGESSITIGGGSRIGIVDFNGAATLDQPLTDDVSLLTTAINNITAIDGTDAGAAFTLAMDTLLASQPDSAKIIVIFTDGYSPTGIPESQAAKAAGIEIYAVGIGLNIDVSSLNAWASEPISDHVFLSPSSSDLADIIKQIAATIFEPAALNIVLVDVLDCNFKVLDALVSKGTVEILGNKVIWKVSDLGALEEETITLNAKVKYCGYNVFQEVNERLIYHDDEGHKLFFPNPVIRACGLCCLEPYPHVYPLM